MKNKGLLITLIVILSFIAILLSSFMYLLLNNKIKFGTMNTELISDDIYEKEYEKINIDMNAGDVYLNGTNEKFIRVVVYASNNDEIITKEDKTLDINIKQKPCIGICISNEKDRIEVYIPNNYDKDINIKNKYGDTKIRNLSNSNIKIDANAGDIDIDSTLNLNINSKYGDIRVKNINNSFNIEQNAGDINIDNINIKENSYIKNKYGDIKINNINEIYVDAKTNLGDIRINNNYRNGEIILKLENNLGDIEVNN